MPGFEPPLIRRGTLLSYWYEWARERERGLEPEKPRETVVASVYTYDGTDFVLIVPLTSTPPRTGQLSYELPRGEVRRIGRGEIDRLWARIDECNVSPLHGSVSLAEAEVRGELDPDVFRTLYRALYAAQGRRQVRHVRRD